jgi:hypothetical protein
MFVKAERGQINGGELLKKKVLHTMILYSSEITYHVDVKFLHISEIRNGICIA